HRNLPRRPSAWARPRIKPTSVSGTPKTVNPTKDPQDSGLKVANKDKDTKVTAKDEDGNEIPVIIKDDGTVEVTPGTNVDGPITVTVTDPDLKDGSQTFTVPVKGHEAGRDDNNSDTSTSKVPADNKDHGIDGQVTGDTTGVTGKVVDGNGNTVPGTVKIDKDGKVTVKVPETTKPGKYDVVIEKGGKEIDRFPIEVTKPGTAEGSIPGLTEEQAQVCVGASAASAVPLLLLIPIALGLAMDNQQVKDITAGFGKTLEDINTGIQKTLGIYNPQLAVQFRAQVAPHLQNLALAAGFIAAIGLLAGVAAPQCTPNGGSSNGSTANK
ncbi:hypothetical protein ACX3T8_12405, partial [Corynebacterium pyruviciproducens]